MMERFGHGTCVFQRKQELEAWLVDTDRRNKDGKKLEGIKVHTRVSDLFIYFFPLKRLSSFTVFNVLKYHHPEKK